LVDIDKRICPMNTLLDSQSKQRKEKSVFWIKNWNRNLQ
jgi:hypothetical protein